MSMKDPSEERVAIVPDEKERPATTTSTARLSHFAACAPCRRRKLRCDGVEPVCGTCARASRVCIYSDVRKGVRKQRTSMKILEARLGPMPGVAVLVAGPRSRPAEADRDALRAAELESLNKAAPPSTIPTVPVDTTRYSSVDVSEISPESWDRDRAIPSSEESPFVPTAPSHMSGTATQAPGLGLGFGPGAPTQPSSHASHDASNGHSQSHTHKQPSFADSSPHGMSTSADDAFAMISLGLEEPLPMQEAQDQLNALYFTKVHPFMPILHPARYLASASLPAASRLRPPVCLSYAVWAHAAAASDAYRPFRDIFYQRARKYAHADEMESFGQLSLTVAHTQTWVLLAVYEQTHLQLGKGFVSVRKAAALCVTLGLYRLDGVGLTFSKVDSPADDWIELEQRRRTFWLVFALDHWTCAGAGYPPAFDEQDIHTDLPAPEDAFTNGVVARGMKLSEAMTPAGARNVSTFSAIAIIASLFGRILVHLHRPDPEGRSIDDLDNKFWRSFRSIDQVLLNTVLCFPGSKAAASGLTDPNVVLLNVSIYACIISLHQTAQFAAGKNPRLALVSQEARNTCMTAAQDMVAVLQQVPDHTLLNTSPFTPYCLYLGARVFVLALREKLQEEGEDIRTNLRLVISKMEILRTSRPYTSALLLQLDVDLASLEDLNPAGHITTMKAAHRNTIEKVDTSETSAVNVAIHPDPSRRSTSCPSSSPPAHMPYPSFSVPPTEVAAPAAATHSPPTTQAQTYTVSDASFTLSERSGPPPRPLRPPTSNPLSMDCAWSADMFDFDAAVSVDDMDMDMAMQTGLASDVYDPYTGDFPIGLDTGTAFGETGVPWNCREYSIGQ